MFYNNNVNIMSILQIDSQTLLYNMFYFLPLQQYNNSFTSIKINVVVLEDNNINLLIHTVS